MRLSMSGPLRSPFGVNELCLKDGSLELESRYSCTQPAFVDSDDSEGSTPGLFTCSLGYNLEDDAPITLAAMKIGESFVSRSL